MRSLTFRALLPVWIASSMAAVPARAPEKTAKIPLVFEENRGQAAKEVRYIARSGRNLLMLTDREAIFLAGKSRVRMSLGRETASRAKGIRRLSSYSNYFIGNDSQHWLEDVPHFGEVEYENIAPSTDMVFRANQSQPEFDLILRPGSDPAKIRLEYQGARSLRVDPASGDLMIGLNQGEIRQRLPQVYQEDESGRHAVRARYVLHGNRVSFSVAAYDSRRTLVVDPVISYFSYFGGSGADGAMDMTQDPGGYLYVVGQTASADLPLGNTLETLYQDGSDAFVAKFSPTGAFQFATYLGGVGSDSANGVAVDTQQNIYLVGGTDSTNFPITGGLPVFGTSGIFYIEFNFAGHIAASMLIGTGQEVGTGVAYDPLSGKVYLVGSVVSEIGGLIAKGGQKISGIQNYFNGGAHDAFLMVFTPAQISNYFYATYLGGWSDDYPLRVAFDSKSLVYVTGYTNSPNFPYPTQIQLPNEPGIAGGPFVLKLNLDQNQVLYSTYVGDIGSGLPVPPAVNPLVTALPGPSGLALDSSGNAYIGGGTSGANFSLAGPKANPYGGGSQDGFIIKLNPSGTIVYSTLFGGNGADVVVRLATDSAGNLYATGATGSTDLPVTPNAVQPTFGGHDTDAFLAEFDPTGAPLYVSYLGGPGNDGASALVVDSKGGVWISGATTSDGLATSSAVQPNRKGDFDAFLAKIDLSKNPAPVISLVENAASLVSGVSMSSFITIKGNGLSTTPARTWQFSDFLNGQLPLGMDNVSVTVDGLPAAIYYISPTQINAIAPADTNSGTINVVVTNSNGSSAPFQTQLAAYSPAFFTFSAPNDNYIAATLSDGTYLAPIGLFGAASPSRPASAGDVILLYATGFGPTNPPTPLGPAVGPEYQLASKVSIMIGNLPAAVIFAGMGPLYGEYQFNVQVPSGLAPGDQPVVATINGLTTQPGLSINVK